ncbi:MAG: hypothetical protein ACI4JE_01160 [Ruminococcus sp.]|nr:hypothetical protein [Oscillospiraceae bacterium]
MNTTKVRFHLPDFTRHSKLNLVLLNMMKNMPQYFRDGIEIASFYGVFPPSMWNGGRTIVGGAVCGEEYIKTALKTFNDKGIPLRFTFTNPAIKEEHLNDEFCNAVMRLADNGLNEVIVYSPVLEEYIRKNYPNYKITSSTCKRILDESTLDKELEKDYHIVVVDYALNNKFDILEKLPHKEKCEFLVNSSCIADCPFRSEEYYMVGEQQIAYCEHIKKHPGKEFRMSDYAKETVNTKIKCPASGTNFFQAQKLAHHISPDDIWNKYVPMGFNQFKIEGRTASTLYLIECYMYYLVKPECRDEARFMFMYNLERNGVIKY